MIAPTPVQLLLDGSAPAASVFNGNADLNSIMDSGSSLDLRDLAERARLICPRAHASKIKERIVALRRRLGAAWLTRFGSGDFHHLSLMLIETLTPPRPVTLVLFDNHPDWFVLPPRYHCGNWVAGVLGLPWIERVILIGQGGDDLRFAPMHFAPLGDIASGRLSIYPYRTDRVRAPLTARRSLYRGGHVGRESGWMRFETVAELGLGAIASKLASELRGKPVYISVDKDCLRPSDAATDWDQGEIGLDDLVNALKTITIASELIGADVCGDRASTKLTGVWKRFDAGRLRVRWQAPTPADTGLNRAASEAICAALGRRDFDGPGVAARGDFAVAMPGGAGE